MKPVYFLLLLLLGLCACSHLKPAMPGQTAQHFRVERKQVLALDYLLYLPPDYRADMTNRWPMILFLHGVGERGTNVWAVAKHGMPKVVGQQTNFPFIVVSPQCPTNQAWQPDELLALLDTVERQYAVDTNRVYLTGLSMGGFGTWDLGLRHPERFAAIAPVCGGGQVVTPRVGNRDAIIRLPVWAFHGAKDPVVPLEESERMVKCLRAMEVREVKFTVYPEAKHDCWTETYANPELYQWFLQHAR